MNTLFKIICPKSSNVIQSCRLVYDTSFKSAKSGGPTEVFEQKVVNGTIKNDTRQREVVKLLQNLYDEISNYNPRTSFIRAKYSRTDTPKGVYIYGSVGAGKTMLMDVFYNSVKTDFKRRAHFNDFMADVHSRIHLAKLTKPKVKPGSDKAHPWDPVKPVADDLIKNAWLLCFDEFQVTDIADAMILKSLFTELFKGGIVMVATSNRPPKDLYKDGLQRSHFLPFIDVLEANCSVISLNGPDYRTDFTSGLGSKYFVIRSGDEQFRMDHIFRTLCESYNYATGTKSIRNLGRNLIFHKTCGPILDVTFSELCGKPLSAADYVQIAKSFEIILLRDIPQMNLDDRNAVRRFILLIDSLYDQKVKIVVSAYASPQNLFISQGGTRDYESHMKLMDDLAISEKSDDAKASIFSGSEEIFAFGRTVSRLIEMTSDGYWNSET